jgi:DNA-binding GntR family transcriptional regulator
MNSSRIVPTALYEQVAERLRQRIFAHDLAPGQWVDEQALAEEYGISRTPLREALKVLAAEGLVTLKPRRGCYVTELSERDVSEIVAILALLEARCAHECTAHAGKAEVARLEAIHKRLEDCGRSGDVEGFFDANQEFHRVIQEIADNRWATQIIADMRKVIKLSRHHSLLVQGRLQNSLKEHRDIMAAIKAGDPARAEAAMRRHIEQGRDALTRHTRRDDAPASVAG